MLSLMIRAYLNFGFNLKWFELLPKKWLSHALRALSNNGLKFLALIKHEKGSDLGYLFVKKLKFSVTLFVF